MYVSKHDELGKYIITDFIGSLEDNLEYKMAHFVRFNVVLFIFCTLVSTNSFQAKLGANTSNNDRGKSCERLFKIQN